MAHFAPYVIRSATPGLQGISLGFHAYSLRIDNISNQWLQEASTLVWIPPYSLGVVIKLWGTSVAIITASAPTGQAQMGPIAGEYAVAVFSDEYRAENPGVPVRQFTLVQAVSDLTEGPQPALPPVGVCRIYADANGTLWHLHSDGSFYQLWDTNSNLGGVLTGKLPGAGFAVPMLVPGLIRSTNVAGTGAATGPGGELTFNPANNTTSINSYDRTAAQYLAMDIAASTSAIHTTNGNLTLTAVGGDVIPNLHNIVSSATAGANAVVNQWVQYPSIQFTPPPGNWMLWFTAHMYVYGPFPWQADTNVWTVSGGALSGEVCTRQFIQPSQGGYYSCTGFGLFGTAGATPITLATFINGGAANLAPGIGNASSRIMGFRYA
jgi:hypothetical protein